MPLSWPMLIQPDPMNYMSMPVTYVSRSLTPTEKSYTSHKLEFHALKWDGVDNLRNYLYGARFVVNFNINRLTYILTMAKQDAMGHRWLASLSGFHFSLKYLPGVRDREADTLSRRPYDPETLSEERT